MAHECGHALGLDHNWQGLIRKDAFLHNYKELMDAGQFRSFFDYTGIDNFDTKTGKVSLVEPMQIIEYKRRALRKLLPIFS